MLRAAGGVPAVNPRGDSRSFQQRRGINVYHKLRLAHWRVWAMAPISVASVLLFLLPGSASAASATVCTSTLPPGTYHSIIVPAGQTCDLGVGPVHVRAGVRVGAGATFSLGFELGPNTGTISGGIRATNASQVLVHNARINGGVSVQGGAGPTACTDPIPHVCFTDFEDNTINGGATINGYNGVFLGFIRNHVNGAVAITNNMVFDEIDIGTNTVHGSLSCAGNNPLENTGARRGRRLTQ